MYIAVFCIPEIGYQNSIDMAATEVFINIVWNSILKLVEMTSLTEMCVGWQKIYIWYEEFGSECLEH